MVIRRAMSGAENARFRKKLRLIAAQPGAARVATEIPTDTYDRLAAQALRTGTPMATLFRQAIEAKLDRDEIAGMLPAMKDAAE